jgi:hypothetical protein
MSRILLGVIWLLPTSTLAAESLSRDEAVRVGKELVRQRVETVRRDREAEFKARRIELDGKAMPFDFKIFGEKPAGGRSLFLSMHGGGGAPARVNDQQYENQKRLYQPSEGVYLAPRAPTNTWNLWHEAHIDAFFDRLIEDLAVFEDVDRDKVYLMGYSAGGDGVYQLAPRMADRFAAASMMAGHPNEASPLSLRNLPFAIHVGALDSAYNRNNVAGEWGKRLDKLREDDPDGYVHLTELHPGRGHWMNREDASAVPWMARFRRDPLPKRVVWHQDDVTHPSFYWLAVETPKAGTTVIAEREGSEIRILKAEGLDAVTIRLDDRMLDLDRPVRVVFEGRTLFEGRVGRSRETLEKTLAERGDPAFLFPAEVRVALGPERR